MIEKPSQATCPVTSQITLKDILASLQYYFQSSFNSVEMQLVL